METVWFSAVLFETVDYVRLSREFYYHKFHTFLFVHFSNWSLSRRCGM